MFGKDLALLNNQGVRIIDAKDQKNLFELAKSSESNYWTDFVRI